MTSLELLIPETTPPRTLNRTFRTIATAEFLEQVTSRLIGHISNHDWTNPELEDFIAPEFKAFLEYNPTPESKSRQEFLDNYKAFVKANADYTMQIISVNAEVSEKNGTATVWMLLRIYGHPTGVCRESVTVGYWRSRAGKWMYYRQTGIRGIAWYLDR